MPKTIQEQIQRIERVLNWWDTDNLHYDERQLVLAGIIRDLVISNLDLDNMTDDFPDYHQAKLNWLADANNVSLKLKMHKELLKGCLARLQGNH